MYTRWNSPKTGSVRASERGILISLVSMPWVMISRALRADVPILIALEAALFGAVRSAGGGMHLTIALLDIVGELLLDLNGRGAMGDGLGLEGL
ncbi:MAG TPA: hypothetical protein VEP90_29930, partial [Methylomirabilota bacterium]|nr:hypothetical protein [Methylomirabilota bacterium]